MRFLSVCIVFLFLGSCASKKERRKCQGDCSGDIMMSGEQSGFDVYGNSKACENKDGLLCSTQWIYPVDALPGACEAAGGYSTQCGCHDYICSKKVTLPSKTSISNPSKIYKGYDAYGREKKCREAVNIQCLDDWKYPQDALPQACRMKGALLIQCGCHDFICSSRIQLEPPPETISEDQSGSVGSAVSNSDAPIEGFGVYGDVKTCTPKQEQSCTEEFRYPQDQLPTTCKQYGGEVTQCGCHDYLCSKQVHLPPIVFQLEPRRRSGFDIHGNTKECESVVVEKCPQAWKEPEDTMPKKCRDKGGLLTSCGCHDYICSVQVD